MLARERSGIKSPSAGAGEMGRDLDLNVGRRVYRAHAKETISSNHEKGRVRTCARRRADIGACEGEREINITGGPLLKARYSVLE